MGHRAEPHGVGALGKVSGIVVLCIGLSLAIYGFATAWWLMANPEAARTFLADFPALIGISGRFGEMIDRLVQACFLVLVLFIIEVIAYFLTRSGVKLLRESAGLRLGKGYPKP